MKIFRFYAAAFLALWAQGTLGFVGIAKESTWGTAVGATDYFEIMSENMTTGIDAFPVRNAFAGFYEPDDYAGARRNGGDMVMFGQPVSLGHLLKAAFNTMSHTAVLSGFLHRLNFSTVKSEFADGVPSQPYTLEVHRDVGSSFRYTGAVCNRLQLALAPNQDLRATVNWIAKAQGFVARSAPTFPSSSSDPFTFDAASLSLGGSATARWEAFNLTVNNNLNGILRFNNTNEIAAIRRSDSQVVRIGGTLDFIDAAEFQDFTAQTERELKLNIFRSQSFNITLTAPRFVYRTFPTGIPGRDRLTVAFEGNARYSVGSGLAIDIGLTTTKSNY